MYSTNITKFFFLVCFVALFTTGCKKDEEPGLGRYGMLDKGSPEYTAVTFMRSVYEDDNIDVAISLSTSRLARILERYHTNRNVQRHLLNLKYDKVTVTPQGSTSVGRNEYSERSTISLFFSGYYGDDKIEDLRSVELVREDGDWKVSKIYTDPFM